MSEYALWQSFDLMIQYINYLRLSFMGQTDGAPELLQREDSSRPVDISVAYSDKRRLP